MGTGICGLDPLWKPQKLVPHDNKVIHSTSFSLYSVGMLITSIVSMKVSCILSKPSWNVLDQSTVLIEFFSRDFLFCGFWLLYNLSAICLTTLLANPLQCHTMVSRAKEPCQYYDESDVIDRLLVGPATAPNVIYFLTLFLIWLIMKLTNLGWSCVR